MKDAIVVIVRLMSLCLDGIAAKQPRAKGA